MEAQQQQAQEDEELDKSSSSSSQLPQEEEDTYDQEVQALAREETRRVKIFRVLVVVIILSVGAALSGFTYSILSQQNQQDAKDAFRNFASTIRENWKFRVSTIFSASRALSRSITTSAFTSPQKFPYFTVPAWEAKVSQVKSCCVVLCGAVWCFTCTVVGILVFSRSVFFECRHTKLEYKQDLRQ